MTRFPQKLFPPLGLMAANGNKPGTIFTPSWHTARTHELKPGNILREMGRSSLLWNSFKKVCSLLIASLHSLAQFSTKYRRPTMAASHLLWTAMLNSGVSIQHVVFSPATQLQFDEADVFSISLKLCIWKYNHLFQVAWRFQAATMWFVLVSSTQLVSFFPINLFCCPLKSNIAPLHREKGNTFTLFSLACWFVLYDIQESYCFA